jgi:hypothetical protein
MARDYHNYSGQTSQPFTVLSAFLKDGANYRFEFDTWRSATDFNNETDPYPPLHRSVAAAASFATDNATLLTQIGTLLINELGLGGRGFTLSGVQWMPVAKVLTCQAVKGDDSRTLVKQSGDYTSFITANLTAFQNLNTAVWNYAHANDGFFAAMTPAV